MRRFAPPWTVEQIPGGFKVLDANGQSLAYVYGRETKADAGKLYTSFLLEHVQCCGFACGFALHFIASESQ